MEMPARRLQDMGAVFRYIARCFRTVFVRQGANTLASPKLSGGMNVKAIKQQTAGKVGWVLLWLLGVPIPVLLILFLLRGCT
jgi:hypothetical protein